MDVRAFGSRYGFSAALPYASGFMVSAGTNKVLVLIISVQMYFYPYLPRQ